MIEEYCLSGFCLYVHNITWSISILYFDLSIRLDCFKVVQVGTIVVIAMLLFDVE